MTTNLNSTLPYPGYIPYDQRNFSSSFLPSMLHAFLLTLVAELGDKTFIMLIILQLKANKSTVLCSSLFAQIGMNSIAIFIGYAVDYMLYKNFIDYIGILFFFVYAIWLIGESLHSSDQSFEKDLDVFAQNKQMHKRSSSKIIFRELTPIPEIARDDSKNPEDMTTPLLDYKNFRESVIVEQPGEDENERNEPKMFWAIFLSMTLSECGDRTQISSLTMAAIYDVYGVLCGSCAALVCTVVLGVFCGKIVIKYLHEKFLNLVLGVLFFIYAVEIYMRKNNLSISF